MYMSDSEVLGKYRRADNKKEILQILAELNACNIHQMEQFLLDHGISKDELHENRMMKKKMNKAEMKVEKKEEAVLPDKVKAADQFEEEPKLNPDEQAEVDRALSIPIPVQKAISHRIEALTKKIIKLERERDCLCDYLEGR